MVNCGDKIVLLGLVVGEVTWLVVGLVGVVMDEQVGDQEGWFRKRL